MPPIRYPLPTLVVLLLTGLIVWRGEAMTRPFRAALQDRWKTATKGPEYPHSDHPRIIAGSIARKALLLHDETPVSPTPVAPPSDTLHKKMFVDVYDVWPSEEKATHYRIGNRDVVGWVRAQDLLDWSTRLVVHTTAFEEPGPASLPFLGGTTEGGRIAVWERGHLWEKVARYEVNGDKLPPEAWGAWLSRAELLALLRRSMETKPGPAADLLRLRAVLGRLLDDRPLTAADLEAARRVLPSTIFTVRADVSKESVSDRLARINEQWSPEASWGGLAFQFIPLSALP